MIKFQSTELKKGGIFMKYFVADAFAQKVFEGNPAGICALDQWLPDETMQKIAAENNLSETAFFVPTENGYHLRWFTPKEEINLCGHATLATAFIITQFINPTVSQIRFETMSGELTVEKKGDLFEMDFPNIPPIKHTLTNEMIEALGVTPLETYYNRDLMFVLENEEQVKNLSPNFSKLENLSDGLGVFVTAKGDKCDFVSRAFFPKLKVNEDPVTGSVHCNLIPFWSERLAKKQLTAKQLSKRGGTLYCKQDGDRVKIGGKAVLYLIAEINIEKI